MRIFVWSNGQWIAVNVAVDEADIANSTGTGQGGERTNRERFTTVKILGQRHAETPLDVLRIVLNRYMLTRFGRFEGFGDGCVDW
jgi:hypothetical protein